MFAQALANYQLRCLGLRLERRSDLPSSRSAAETKNTDGLRSSIAKSARKSQNAVSNSQGLWDDGRTISKVVFWHWSLGNDRSKARAKSDIK